MKKVLVAGASGYLGGYVVKAFKKRGYYVRALARDAVKLSALRDFIDDTHIGRVTDPSTLKGVCRHMDVVFSSVGITRQRDGFTYMDVDFQGNLNLLEQAQTHEISKFIYISVFNAHRLDHLKMVRAKQKFVQALQQSHLKHAVIYPNGFFADLREVLNMARRGRGYCLGDGRFKANPIHGADLAEICVDAVASDQSDIHVGGPEVLTQKQIVEMAFDVLGKPAKLSHIPLWMPRVLLPMARMLTPVNVHGPLEFFLTVMAMDMVAPIHGTHHLKGFFREQAAM